MKRFQRSLMPMWIAVVASWGTLPALADEVRFPDTAPGRHARAFFESYDAGEAAMRAFFAAHVAAAALDERPVDMRLDGWRRMHETQGHLTPLRVVGEGPGFLAVAARAEKTGEVRLRFQCDADEPHGLLGIRLEVEEDGKARPEDSGPAPKDDAEMVARLGAMLDSLTAADEFSGAVLLDKGGERLFGRGFGLASREARRPNGLDTRFNVGSINKIFTAVAIHQLEQQGKLRLDDTVSRWLPEYPKEKGGRITIRMLLEHRGGVPDFFNAKFDAADHSKIRSLQDWFAFVRDEPLDFEPGSRQAYSNGGYLLLGMIVAKVSGEDYFDYVRRHIYAPAGMTRSDHYARDDRAAALAVPYTRRGGASGWHDGSAGLPARGSPAGGGYSTAEDLLAFARALREHRLLDTSHTEAMIGARAGLGIAGGSPGCNGMLLLEGPYTLVVLANLDPPAAERIGEKTGRWLEALSGGGGGERVRVSAGGGR
jgi:CubicO group peptidase (beta-lactamase class C family)